MHLIDTSVWIDFLRGVDNAQVRVLEKLLEEEADIFYTGLIIQELLQGIRKKNERSKVVSLFDSLVMIRPDLNTHIKASEIYVLLLSKGLTIRSSIDCLIAALALEYDLNVLHRDRDFKFISKHFPLKVLKV